MNNMRLFSIAFRIKIDSFVKRMILTIYGNN